MFIWALGQSNYLWYHSIIFSLQEPSSSSPYPSQTKSKQDKAALESSMPSHDIQHNTLPLYLCPLHKKLVIIRSIFPAFSLAGSPPRHLQITAYNCQHFVCLEYCFFQSSFPSFVVACERKACMLWSMAASSILMQNAMKLSKIEKNFQSIVIDSINIEYTQNCQLPNNIS